MAESLTIDRLTACYPALRVAGALWQNKAPRCLTGENQTEDSSRGAILRWSLTVGERTPTLWNPMLHRAFPKGTRRARVQDLMARVVRFRNRLAHNEPVFSTRTGLADRLVEVQELFELVDPKLLANVAEHSTLSAAISSCPMTGLTTATGLG